jgi:hypothetical protein
VGRVEDEQPVGHHVVIIDDGEEVGRASLALQLKAKDIRSR